MLNIVTELLEGGLETRHFKGLFLKPQIMYRNNWLNLSDSFANGKNIDVHPFC